MWDVTSIQAPQYSHIGQQRESILTSEITVKATMF